MTAPLTVENGLLTPTPKVKRRAVESRFAAAFDALVQGRTDAANAPAAPARVA